MHFLASQSWTIFLFITEYWDAVSKMYANGCSEPPSEIYCKDCMAVKDCMWIILGDWFFTETKWQHFADNIFKWSFVDVFVCRFIHLFIYYLFNHYSFIHLFIMYLFIYLFIYLLLWYHLSVALIWFIHAYASGLLFWCCGWLVPSHD